MTKVVSVKVSDIRPQYSNLKEWMHDNNNVYIGRKCIVFIDNARFPKVDSIWANPFKVSVNESNANVVSKYRTYIVDKLNKKEISYESLLELKNKNLGCWCKSKNDNPCHGDILVDLIENYKPTKL